MITIKRDRGWENPQSWSDVIELPGYVSEVDPKAVKLDAVIGKYREPELRVCGLTSCHRKHYRGYLVSCKDGKVTNIGVDCGKTHFGVDFETMSRQLDRDWQNQERRIAIAAAKARISQWQEECERLLNGTDEKKGAKWADRQHRRLLGAESKLPTLMLQMLRNAIKNGDGVLYVERTASEKDKEIAKETGQSIGATISEEIGTLYGVVGVGELEIIRETVPRDIVPNLNKLSALNVDEAGEGELRFWAKWSGEVDGKLNRVNSILNDALRFFSRENIALLAELAENKEQELIVMKYAKEYQ